MKANLTFVASLCLTSTAFAATNDDSGRTEADTPLLAHPLGSTDLMAEDNTLEPYFPELKLRDDLSVKWGGRLMFDTSVISADANHPSGGADGSEFRRARFFAAIDISEHVSAKAQYDFAGGDVGIRDLYIKFKTEYGGIIAGHHYQPISIENLTSSRYITFIERAMSIEAFAPGRDTGISTSNRFGENTGWALGVFRPVGDSGDGTGDGDYSLTGRVTHAIKSGGATTHLGVSTSFSGSRDVTRVRSRPEAHQANRVLDTGTGASGDNMIVGLEFAWTSGPNTVQAEYLMNTINDFTANGAPEDVTLSGYYVHFSHFLTGESRPYNKSGKWGRIKPKEHWEGKGLNGAWEAAARYSTLDFTDGAFDQEAMGITVGMNWYMNPNTRLMLNVVRSESEISGVDGDFTAVIGRMQVDW